MTVEPSNHLFKSQVTDSLFPFLDLMSQILICRTSRVMNAALKTWKGNQIKAFQSKRETRNHTDQFNSTAPMLPRKGRINPRLPRVAEEEKFQEFRCNVVYCTMDVAQVATRVYSVGMPMTFEEYAKNRKNEISTFPDVQCLSLEDIDEKTRANNEELSFILGCFPNLLELNINHLKNISNRGLRSICNASPNLTSLKFFGHQKISTKGFQSLCLLRLNHLNLGGKKGNLTCQNITYIAQITTLTSLDLAESKITDKCLAILQNLSLSDFNLRECNSLSDQGLSHIAMMTSLRYLRIGSSKPRKCLSKSARFTENGIAQLTALRNLEVLVLSMNTQQLCEAARDRLIQKGLKLHSTAPYTGD